MQNWTRKPFVNSWTWHNKPFFPNFDDLIKASCAVISDVPSKYWITVSSNVGAFELPVKRNYISLHLFNDLFCYIMMHSKYYMCVGTFFIIKTKNWFRLSILQGVTLHHWGVAWPISFCQVEWKKIKLLVPFTTNILWHHKRINNKLVVWNEQINGSNK